MKILSVLKIVIVVLVVAFASIVAYSFGKFSNQPKLIETTTIPVSTQLPFPNFTGEDLQKAINDYRQANGIKPVPIDDKLCNNLAQRYIDITSHPDIAHYGFADWLAKNIRTSYVSYSEDYAGPRFTVKDIIDMWAGSPGHRDSILDVRNSGDCTYAMNGYGIVEFGH